MSTPTGGAGGGGFDWSSIISGAGEGAFSALKGQQNYEMTKRDAKEAKRRTLANLMASSMKRNRNLFRKGQEHADELNDYQSQALQQIARGFVDALQGSTGRT